MLSITSLQIAVLSVYRGVYLWFLLNKIISLNNFANFSQIFLTLRIYWNKYIILIIISYLFFEFFPYRLMICKYLFNYFTFYSIAMKWMNCNIYKITFLFVYRVMISNDDSTFLISYQNIWLINRLYFYSWMPYSYLSFIYKINFN